MTADGPPARPWKTGWLACALPVGILAVYARTLSAPFEFDDVGSIVRNATIRHLVPLGSVLAPPHGEGATVGGRPLLNLSFAINYAISGEAVWSYHALNIAIHIGCALLLFDVSRRMLSAVKVGAVGRITAAGTPSKLRERSNSDVLALLLAALWSLHPLQTEAVTYLSQRAESLASLFYLLAIYSFWRAVGTRETSPADPLAAESTPATRSVWKIVSVATVFCGVATKEIVCTAPLLILLIDATVVAGSFRGAWRARRGYYLASIASWALLGALAFGTQGRGGTAGFGTEVSVWSYLLTQTNAITLYLGLAVWPSGLVFDYGTGVVHQLGDVWPQAIVVVLLLVGSVIGFVRAKTRSTAVTALLGVAFFFLLAPSSSFVPIGSQPIAEHRMYLPLAVLAALIVVATDRWLGRWMPLLGVAAIGCGIITYQRNEVYRTEIDLWTDTAVHAPNNARAHNNLGNALIHVGRLDEAVEQYEAAVSVQPDYADGQSNLGYALVKIGRPNEALPHAEIAVKVKPASADAWLNYALALTATHRDREAIPALEKAIGYSPDSAAARYDLGNVYYRLGEYAQAAATYEAALAQEPRHRDARFNLAYAWLQLGRPDEALKQFQLVAEQFPDDAGAHAETGNLLAHFGRTREAVAQLETALRLQPDFPAVRVQLERLRSSTSQQP